MSPIPQRGWAVCPVCRTSYDASAGTCPVCPEPEADKGLCRRCGESLDSGARYCDACGAPVGRPGSPRRNASRTNRINPLNLDECPQCHREIPLSADKCPGCGNRLEYLRNLFQEPFTGDLFVCHKCHRRHGATATFCEDCGTDLAPPLFIPRERNLLARPTASVGRQFAAGALDHLALFLFVIILVHLAGLVWGLWLFLAANMSSGAEIIVENLPLLVATFLLLGLAPYPYYFTVGLARGQGKTIGGRVCRVRVIREDGYRLNAETVALRFAGIVISWLTLGAGFLLVAVSRDRRSLPDLLSKTRVVVDPLLPD